LQLEIFTPAPRRLLAKIAPLMYAGAMQPFLDTLAFAPDAFQRDAMQVIQDGHSVVVCAPTGSGKTLIAEYAAHKAIVEGRKIFYTTPLKALSNQKMMDFKRQYGDERVGLLTGDTTLNRDAQILVMTTEVFRNMLYGVQEESKLLREVSCVVLDECHFMNDAERGTVWEESIIYCPDFIQIIALSATVSNALDLTDWINEVHHNTILVESDFRPVPLRFFHYNREDLMPLFKHDTRELNSRLRGEGKGRRPGQMKAFEPNKLIESLNERQMLPAIVFTFSRKGCDKALFETRKLNLLTPEERGKIAEQMAEYLQRHPFLEGNRYLTHIQNGFASHHAGLLPALKGLVEGLFQQGLIKAVFATETLAAGINMPARSTVITSISKRTNDGHRLLTASEFLQMSGRAGRRGMDEVGYVVTVSSAFESAYDVSHLASSEADPLNSRFSPTYGMVLNLLQKHTLEEAEFLISKSFSAFTADRRLEPLRADLCEHQMALDEVLSFQCPDKLTEKDFEHYLKSKSMLKETHKFAKMLKMQMKRHGQSPEMMAEYTKADGKRQSLGQTVEATPCYKCKLYQAHIHQGERRDRLEKRVKTISKELEEASNQCWREFLNHYHLLKDMGFLNDKDYPTEPGLLTAGIRAENELYLAQIVMSDLLDDLTPSELAGVVCALVNDSTRENLVSRCSISPQGQQTLKNIQKQSKRLFHLQRQYKIDTPLLMNPIASGLVEAWTEGLPWAQLISMSNIDEGDLVRIVRRTADILRQFTRVPQVPLKLADTASLALKSLYRDPIREETIGEPAEPPESPEAEVLLTLLENDTEPPIQT